MAARTDVPRQPAAHRYHSDGCYPTGSLRLSPSGSSTFHVYAKNARSLRCDKDIETLLSELASLRWDAVLLSETWRPSRAEKRTTVGGPLFVGSSGMDGSRGVAILLHQRWVDTECKFQAIDERICSLDVACGRCQIRFISVYFPQCGYGDAALERCYAITSELHEEARKEARLAVIGGDFNAEVGVAPDDTDVHPSLGRHGHSDRNARGEMMRRWAASEELWIGNTHYDKVPNNKWTHRSSNGRERVIDYLLFR